MTGSSGFCGSTGPIRSLPTKKLIVLSDSLFCVVVALTTRGNPGGFALQAR